MDKAKYKKMYEIADRLSKVDTANLNEQQLSEHTAMIEKLKQIAMEDNGFATFMQQLQTTGTDNPVQIVVYGKMPAHMRAEEVWDALMEILPNEYPSIQAAQQKTAEIARYNGAVVAEKPRSEAEKIVKQFNAYGIKARINTSEGVAEGSGKNVVKSVKVGNFRHDLVDTGMGWQVRIYNGDELYDTGMSKNSEQKGLAALEDAVAYTEKQTRTKRQGVSEYGTHPSQRVDPRTGKKYVPPKSPLGKGVAEGSQPPVCKHCGKRQGEHQRGKCPKGTKTAVGYTDYGPTKFEPKEPKQQGVAEGLGNKKVTIQGLKNWIAKAQAEGYEVEEVMKGEMWRAVNPKTGGLKGTFHTTGTPGRGSLWGSGPDGTPADSGTLVIKQGVAEGPLNPKARAKAQMLKMYGDGQISFSKTSNGGYFIQHEDDFGDTNSHPYDPQTGKVDFRGSISSTYYGEGVAEAGVKQLPTQGADYSKYDTDTLKMMLRPGILHRNEARFKALIRKELQKREQQGVAEGSLEEVDRRGFLKGLGAAAIAISPAFKAMAQDYNLTDKEITMLTIVFHAYWVCLNYPKTTDPEKCNRIKQGISEYAKKRTFTSQELNLLYSSATSQNSEKIKDRKWAEIITYSYNAGELVLRDLNQMRPFESVEQGVAEGRYYPSPHDYDSDIDYYAAVDRYLGKKGPRPGDDDWEETAPGDSFGDEDDEKTNEADAPRPTYNVMKLGGALDIDPRMLRVAITRGLQGQATRTDMSVLARSFLNMISNSDDKDIQYIANLIKTGNPKPTPQENTAAIAERNAFVNAMRNVKQGEKFSVGGKEYTKTTKHGEDSEVTENINKEAYDRLKRVFDFSNFKGDV